jgi:sulfhydrogenase subunit gamma (sulfur reductase)
MDWFTATVEARLEVAGAVRLFLEVPDPVRASFTEPGQYLNAKAGTAHGPFALACAPNEQGPLEIFFKRGHPLTDALADLSVGSHLQVTRAEGQGFPLERARGLDLLLVGSGTGQAPLRSVVQSVRRDRKRFGKVTLLLGVRSTEHLAYTSEHPLWEADGVDVHVTLSQSPATWSGRTGWVQQHLPSGDLIRTVAFLVGQKAMTDDVTAALRQRGLPAEQIFLNV